MNRMSQFEKRKSELAKMSDAELKNRFWELCNKVVEPMVDLSKTHTSPSVERSVLARMGIDSFAAKGVVTKLVEAGLLGKGAGHAVLKVSEKYKTDMVGAAKKINDSPDVLKDLFK